MAPPAASTPTRRHEGSWRDSHQGPSGSYPYDYEVMSPNPYGSNRGPAPPILYYYDAQGPPPPSSRGPPGPPPNDYWYSPPPYGSEHPPAQSPVSHRGGGGSFWGPPPPSPYEGYRGGPPTTPSSLRSTPHGHVNHPSQHQHRTPLRRPYAGEQQVGLEPRIPPPSPGETHIMQQTQQRKDFSPPAPAPSISQVPGTRGVQVAVSASADSDETLVSCAPNETAANTVTPQRERGDGNDNHSGMDDNSGSKQGKNEKGDPLSVLADVSAGMGGKNKKSKQNSKADGTGVATELTETTNAASTSPKITTPSASSSNRPSVPMPAPTSPLHRRFKPSPITPSQTPQVSRHSSKRTPAARKHQPITPSRSHDTASTTEAGPQSLRAGWEPPPLPHGGSGSSGGGEHFSSHPEYSGASQHGGSYSPSRRNRPLAHYGAGEYGSVYPTESPALVERGSFDSHGDTSSYRAGAPLYPPSTPTSSRGAYFYDDHPPPPPPPGYGSSGSGGGPYWDSGQPPYSPAYPPPTRGPGGWNQPHPPQTHSDPFYGPPPHHAGPPPPDYSYPPPPAHYGGPEDHDAAMYGGNPPLHGTYHHRGGPHPSMPGPHHPGMPMPPPHMSGPPPPYPYSHPPRMEEKTILRKKFSWKHYPELERFLIANRDEYLKHSNMNYTAEQKQYNNWLTERLLEVAGQHNYMFDPEDFNFVAIRDRIRCYYKSYVQTARKRGLKLPEKKTLKNKVDATTEGKKE